MCLYVTLHLHSTAGLTGIPNVIITAHSAKHGVKTKCSERASESVSERVCVCVCVCICQCIRKISVSEA